MRTASTYPWI